MLRFFDISFTIKYGIFHYRKAVSKQLITSTCKKTLLIKNDINEVNTFFIKNGLLMSEKRNI